MVFAADELCPISRSGKQGTRSSEIQLRGILERAFNEAN